MNRGSDEQTDMKSPGEILCELIRVPSVNPAHSDNTSITGERRMAEALSQHLAERGFAVEFRTDSGPGRPAVVATAGPENARRTLLFEAHLDTVGVDNMTIPPFEGYVRDGRICGRGACDMKGSTAALLHALTPARIGALARRGIRLLVVGAPDEECGTKGATTLAANGLRADHAVVLEPTRCIPVVAHKGAYWYDLLLQGRGGHGSQPQSGVSTNEALARLLPELLRAHKALQNMHEHPLLGHSSLNIGKITGGHIYNIIPDKTLLQLDRRVIPNEPPELFEQAVLHILDELTKEKRLLGGSCRRVNETPAFSTDPKADLPQTLLQAIQDVTGTRPDCEGTSWVSDASPLSRVCGQTVVFGPGDIAQAHTEDEFIEISALEEGSAILGRFLDIYE